MVLFNRSNLDLSRKYGPIYRTDYLGLPSVVVSDPHAIIQCWKDPATFRSNKAFPVAMQQLFNNNSLIMSDGADHARRRAKVLPAFSKQMVSRYFEKVCASACHMWSDVSKCATETNTALPVEDFVRSHLLRTIVRITTEAQMKQDTGTAKDGYTNELRSLFVAFARGPVSPPFTKVWAEAKTASLELKTLLMKLAADRLKENGDIIQWLRQENISEQKAFKDNRIDLLMIIVAATTLPVGNERDISDNDELAQVAATVFELWLGGYFTTASAVFSSLMELEMNPGVLQNLREEQEKISELTSAAVERDMPLLHSFILEVLRMYPPLPHWFRTTSKPTSILGYSLPAGQNVVLDLWSSQRNPSYFHHPDTLDARRFLPGAEGTASPSALLSFGAMGSVHYCVGAALAKTTLKTTLAVLIRNYDIKIVPRTTLDYSTTSEFQPRDGVKVLSCRPLAKQ